MIREAPSRAPSRFSSESDIRGIGPLPAQIDLRSGKRLGREHGKPDHVEAVAGIEIGADGREALGKEHRHGVRRPHGVRRAHDGAGDIAVGAEERRLDEARADPLPFERSMKRAGERAHRFEQRTLVDDGLGETTLSRKPRRRPARRQHLILITQRLIQPLYEAGAEAGGERSARLADQIADALQAEPVEQRLLLRADPQRRHRQRGEHRLLISFRDTSALAVMGERPGGAGSRGDRPENLKALG